MGGWEAVGNFAVGNITKTLEDEVRGGGWVNLLWATSPRPLKRSLEGVDGWVSG